MEPGIGIDQNTLIEVLQNKLSMTVVREAQMEAAIQQLIAENQQLKAQVESLAELTPEVEAGQE